MKNLRSPSVVPFQHRAEFRPLRYKELNMAGRKNRHDERTHAQKEHGASTGAVAVQPCSALQWLLLQLLLLLLVAARQPLQVTVAPDNPDAASSRNKRAAGARHPYATGATMPWLHHPWRRVSVPPTAQLLRAVPMSPGAAVLWPLHLWMHAPVLVLTQPLLNALGARNANNQMCGIASLCSILATVGGD